MSDLLRRVMVATEGHLEMDVQIDVRERVADADLAEHDAWAISDSVSKLKWLRRTYRPTTEADGSLTFPTGCLGSVSAGGHLRFRHRCEWFRKLLADVRFVQDLAGLDELRVTASMWLRPPEAPLARLWAQAHDLPVSPILSHVADRLLAAWPIERVVVARNAVYRRYLLRYYLRSGAITREQFNVHRCKTTAQMDADPALRVL
jgi:hypothetical protein